MSETNTKPENPQAFPTLSRTDEVDVDGTESPAQRHYGTPGMTLRDYFAAHAPQSALTIAEDFDEAARLSFAWADSMLKARESK